MLSKKAFIPIMMAILIIMCRPVSADACELLYSGGDMTDDGANMFMRSEEIYADDNKTYYVSPAGKHLQGEKYQGCTDFVWEFTHDSYKYTARCDGKIDGVCPTCESDHDHTPYEEAGTNDHGVTVSATQSLNANARIREADPFTDGGIEESEMATVLLSEAATAREGVELLTSIYDSVGAGYEGAGVMICDQNEQWYVENLSGHEYIAVLLPAGVTFMQFNVSVLGRIDLDDTEHVIASKHLFDVAKKAGTLVGDEKENIIDYRASYNDYLMEQTDDEDWDEDWKAHVQVRLVAGDKMSLENALALFRVYPIGYEENVNTHLYRFYPKEDQPFGTVEWFAMDNCTYNVFVPSYPMLLTDTWEGYKVQLGETVVTDKKPDKGDYYLNDGEYHIHPDGWDKSYIGTFSALTNLLTYGDLGEQDIALAEYNLQMLQEDFIARFDALSEQIKSEPSEKAREEMMTKADMEMAEQAHDLALALYRNIAYGEDSDLIQAVDQNAGEGAGENAGESTGEGAGQNEKGFPVVPLVIGILLLIAAVIAVRAYYVKRSR